MIGVPKPIKIKKISKEKIWLNLLYSEIVPQFEKWGIRQCEIGFDDICKKDFYLGFAHTRKRRNITTLEGLRRVVLACQPCHDRVEYRCKEYTGLIMEEYLEEIIRKRNEKL